MKTELHFRRFALPFVLALSATLTACGGSSSNSGNIEIDENTKYVAAIATASSDYLSGEVELAELGKDDIKASGGYFSGPSDITVNAYGENYYLIGKFFIDTIKKVNIKDPAIATWDYSTLAQGATGSSNPYQLVFVNEQKAYLIRYGASTAWIVNPSAANESEFYTGELDLSAYIPQNTTGAPNMSSGVIVGNKLFITLERLGSDYQPTNTAYVAVFDTVTDTEINTRPGTTGGLKGIPLQGRNPTRTQHVDGLGLVVVNRGEFGAPFGGTSLDVVDPDTFTVGSMIADEEIATQINNAVFVSPTQGYILNYAGWQNTTLQRFDPSVGISSLETVANLTGGDFRTLDLSPEGTLWLGDANTSAQGVRIFDTTTDQQIDFVETQLLPIAVAFIETGIDTEVAATP
ncbi:hypothetical protein [Marinobacter sp. DY40_1A1]|uniref:hypothetical protein n=1 Tax=Marinobacter sp. DY40_1A1 TaxID=2583229 RepID=UPI001904238D|nr:hypothetical protein [Marinobacter sp. DY40_1A1]MBK1887228.1 hypothetical protein [Marinobacter sp. DY40_1A1]